MKKKAALLTIVCAAALALSVPVFAENEEYTANGLFKYIEENGVNEDDREGSPGNYYALYHGNERLTDWMYDTMDTDTGDSGYFIVSQIIGGENAYGLIDKNGNEVLPCKYKIVSYTKTEGGPIFTASIANEEKVFQYISEYYMVDADSGELVQLPQCPFTDAPADITSDEWAKESIEKAIAVGIVPEELQAGYKEDITRRDFCRLAMLTYKAKTGRTFKISDEFAFDDANEAYIIQSHALGIVSGVGDNRFEPERMITREEAAVMLAALAEKCGLYPQTNAGGSDYSDDAEISGWAKKSVYTLLGIKGEDDYAIMTGVLRDRFAPKDSYTLQQAIVTMYRLYTSTYTEQSYIE